MRVKDLVWMQGVAVRIVLFVVALVSSLKLDVAPCKSGDRNTLVCLIVVLSSLLVDSLHLVAFIL